MSFASAAGRAADFGPPPTPPNLADAATRERFTPAAVDGVARISEIWRLPAPRFARFSAVSPNVPGFA